MTLNGLNLKCYVLRRGLFAWLWAYEKRTVKLLAHFVLQNLDRMKAVQEKNKNEKDREGKLWMKCQLQWMKPCPNYTKIFSYWEKERCGSICYDIWFLNWIWTCYVPHLLFRNGSNWREKIYDKRRKCVVRTLFYSSHQI